MQPTSPASVKPKPPVLPKPILSSVQRAALTTTSAEVQIQVDSSGKEMVTQTGSLAAATVTIVSSTDTAVAPSVAYNSVLPPPLPPKPPSKLPLKPKKINTDDIKGSDKEETDNSDTAKGATAGIAKISLMQASSASILKGETWCNLVAVTCKLFPVVMVRHQIMLQCGVIGLCKLVECLDVDSASMVANHRHYSTGNGALRSAVTALTSFTDANSTGGLGTQLGTQLGQLKKVACFGGVPLNEWSTTGVQGENVDKLITKGGPILDTACCELRAFAFLSLKFVAAVCNANDYKSCFGLEWESSLVYRLVMHAAASDTPEEAAAVVKVTPEDASMALAVAKVDKAKAAAELGAIAGASGQGNAQNLQSLTSKIKGIKAAFRFNKGKKSGKDASNSLFYVPLSPATQHLNDDKSSSGAGSNSEDAVETDEKASLLARQGAIKRYPPKSSDS